MASMMDQVVKAYDMLVPKDQLVVDAMIIALYEKEVEIRKMATGINELLSSKEKAT